MRRALGVLCISVSLLLAAAPFSVAQPAASTPAQASPAPFEDRVLEAARKLEDEPRLASMSPEQRQALVQFVVGNTLFIMFHELGHAVIAEMELPVLGREEDAADSFAIVTGLRMMTSFSERVLIEAGKGWFFNDRREKRDGLITAVYAAHTMNLQRAYQIVCFMVGSNPEKFRYLAEVTKLPKDRQKSCEDDYAITAWSWDTLLEPHRRAADAPETKIEVIYGEAEEKFQIVGRAFKELRFLEAVAKWSAHELLWRAPLTMEMRTCGFVNARWNPKTRRVLVCYELVQEFAELYKTFADDPDMSRPDRARSGD